MEQSKVLRVSMAVLLAFALSFGGMFSTTPRAYAEPEVVTLDDTVVGSDGGLEGEPEVGTENGSTESTENNKQPEESVSDATGAGSADTRAPLSEEEEAEVIAVSPTGDVSVDTVAALIDAVNNADESRTITLTSDFVADMAGQTTSVALNNTQGHDIAIDGNSQTFTSAGSAKFFTVTNPATGGITFQNMNLEGSGAGASMNAGAGGTVAFNNVSISGHASTALTTVGGKLVVKDSSIANGACAIASGGSPLKTIEVINTVFDGNRAGWGAAITTGSNTDVFVTQGSFLNNIGTSGGGYCGGAIATDQANNVNLTITQSYFEGNEAPMGGTVAGGSGGAIAMYRSNNSTLNVSDTYFVGNKAVANETSRNDGGAISVFYNAAEQSARVSIDNCVFENNVANDDGGAILFEGVSSGSASINLEATVTNTTFVGNEAKQLNSSVAGGAVQVYSKARVAFENCTFYQNKALGGSGGAIGMSGGLSGGFLPMRGAVTIENSAFVENTGVRGENYHNVAGWGGAGNSGLTNKGGNVGYDAGTALPAGFSAETVLGTAAATLQTNSSAKQVGASVASIGTQSLPSIYIAPAVDETAGLYADGIATANATATDSRSVARNADKPDAGAVDIGWIKLDPNGGTWSDATIGDYDATRMLSHTDSNNDAFVFIAADTGSTVALPGSTMFSATPSGLSLLGWGETTDSRPGDSDFHAVGSSVLASEGADCEVYYAIWDNTAEITIKLNVARLFGIDRYGTSHQVSTYERQAANEDTVILASGWDYNFPDALTASVLSGYLDNAPIVLTENDRLSADAREAIVDDLGVSRVVIVGSADAVNSDVEAEVAALSGITTVERIGGVDRQETAEKIFEYIGADHSDTAIIARCCDFPDSLTISPWAVATKSPIFLSDFSRDTLTDETKAALATGGFNRILVLGDENSTPATVYEEAKTAAGLSDSQVIRLGGIDRYETSSIVAEWITSADRSASERLTWSKPAIARGDIHPDSLTGGALQGRDRSVILLTKPDEVSIFARPLVQAKNGTINEIRFFGDENAVSHEVTRDFINLLMYDFINWKPDASVTIPLS